MKIEKLEPSKHKAGRWLVWLEDGSLVRTGEGTVVSLSLYEGKELNKEEAGALRASAEQDRLNERAVELLSARPMSRKELTDKLSVPPRRRSRTGAEETRTAQDPEDAAQEREALRQAAEEAADRMAAWGLVNDEEYAKTVARHYAAKGYGEKKLRDELYRRGVPRELWEAALSEAETDGGGLDRLVRQKLKGAKPTRENMKKASDYLARRGFGWEEISEALRRYGAETED